MIFKARFQPRRGLVFNNLHYIVFCFVCDVILLELKAVTFFFPKKKDSKQQPVPSKKSTGNNESKKSLRQEHCAAMRRSSAVNKF